MRVIDRVHSHTTYLRALAQPTAAASLTNVNILMLRITDTAQRSTTLTMNQTNLARLQTNRRILTLTGQQLRTVTSRTHHLSTLTRAHLDVMHNRTHRDMTQLQAVTRHNLRALTTMQHRTHFNTLGRDDVTLL